MPRSGKIRWTPRTLAVPLLLSLTAHALLLAALWFWPVRKESPMLSIQSTRITLDTCVLDSPSTTLLAERALPPDLLSSAVDTALAPQVEGLSSPPRERPNPAALSGSSITESGERGHVSAPSTSLGALTRPRSPGGNLFPVPAGAASVVYVLDGSVSMGIDRKLDFARGELIASLRRLPAGMRFQVIVYNGNAETLLIDGQRDLLPAEPAIVARAISILQEVYAAGNTNHLAALRRGLNLHPDVLYFLTDADDLKPQEVAAITQRNQRTVIHTIELTRRRSSSLDGPLARLANDNRGTHRCVSVSASD